MAVIPTAKGATVTPIAVRSGVSNPALAQLPIVQPPVSPVGTAPNVAPTAGGAGTIQNTAVVNQSTNPSGGFVPMVNTPFTNYQKTAMDSLANTPQSNADMDWAGGVYRDLAGYAGDMFGRGTRLYDEYIPKANQSFDPSSYKSYMNPYIEQVLTPTLDRLRRERDITQSGIAEGASRVGAFGGSREAVQRSLNDEAFDRNTAETTGNLYSSGYGDAMTRAMNQFDSERNRNMRTAEMGQSGINSASTILSNAANNALGLGQQRIGNYRQSAQDRLAAGGLQQQQQQKDLDAVNAEIKNQQNFDKQRVTDLGEILGLLPTGGGSSQTKPGMSWSDIIGGVLGGASQMDWTKLLSGVGGGVPNNGSGTGIGIPKYQYGINF